VETYIEQGARISPYYDSMVAKLIVWGVDREECMARGRRALSEFEIEGIATTIPFHQKVLENQAFIEGRVYTDFIVTEMGE
jgi:acetyl-CoA carboxylase biotin carboxylase subunit